LSPMKTTLCRRYHASVSIDKRVKVEAVWIDQNMRVQNIIWLLVRAKEIMIECRKKMSSHRRVRVVINQC